MFIKIDFQSETPIYLQLRNQIIEGIAKGHFKPNDSLPSVRQLASDIGINLHTINKAYNLLKSENYIAIDRRKGATVLPLMDEPDMAFVDDLKKTLNTLIASSICKGISKDDFLTICSKIYDNFREEM